MSQLWIKISRFRVEISAPLHAPTGYKVTLEIEQTAAAHAMNVQLFVA